MTYLLDTNICIYAIKNKPPSVLQNMQSKLPEGLGISTITLAELEHGVAASAYPEKNQVALVQFLSIFDILAFDDKAATEYGKICACLRKQGKPIGTMDMLIAAHALAGGFILVTNNTREFERVENLQLENWV